MTKPILQKTPEIETEPQAPSLESQVVKEDFPVGIDFANLAELDKEKILIDMFSKLKSRESDRMKLALAVLRENDDVVKAAFNATYSTVVKERYDFLVILGVLILSAFADWNTDNKSASGESEMVYTGIASSLIILVSQVDHWRKKQRFGGADAFVGVVFAAGRLFTVSIIAWKQSSNISLPEWIVPLFSLLMMFMSKHYISELTVLILFVNCAFTCVLINKSYGILFIMCAWVHKRIDKGTFDRNFVKHAKKLQILLFSLVGVIFGMYMVKSNQKLLASLWEMYGKTEDDTRNDTVK